MRESDVRVECVADDPKALALWDAYVARHPHATIYHRSAWRRIFESAFGYRSWFLLARAGEQVVGCLPLYLINTPFRRRLVSVPFRDRGGVLWDTPAALHELVTEAKSLQRAVRASFMELKSLHAYPQESVEALGLVESRYYVRSLLSLDYADAKELLGRLNPRHRTTVRRSSRIGLTFVDESEIPDPVDAWYELHLRTQKKLGIPAFPLAFFTAMFDALRETGSIKIFFVKKDDGVIASSINFLDRQTGVYAYSASDWALQHYRPNDFMVFRILEWLLDQGYRYYDMGSDSPAQAGLIHFKKKWLAAQSPLPIYTFGSSDRSVSDSMDSRYRVARRVFQVMPRRVSGVLSKFLVKHFG